MVSAIVHDDCRGVVGLLTVEPLDLRRRSYAPLHVPLLNPPPAIRLFPPVAGRILVSGPEL